MSESTKELVGRLAANEAVPFDEEALKAMSEDQLKSLEEAYKKPEEKPKPDKAEKTKAASSDPPAPPAEPDPNTVVLTKEDYADIKAAADAHKAQQAAEKARLVAAIGKATDAYSKEALEAKPLDDLQALAKALKAAAPVDYSVRGLPDPNQGSKFEPPPKPYTLALERVAKQRGAKSNDDAGAPN